MATTPRYIGTTADEVKTEVKAAVHDETWRRVFCQDGTADIASGSHAEGALLRAVRSAELIVDQKLAASHGAPFNTVTWAALDELVRDTIRQAVMNMLPWELLKSAPMMNTESAPYRMSWKDGCAALDEIAQDRRRRLPGTSAPAPTPAAGVVEPDYLTTTLGPLGNVYGGF